MNPTVTARIAIATKLPGVTAVTNVVAGSHEVLTDDRFIERVHRPDVGVALTHPVGTVPRVVEHVEPVAELVRYDGGISGVHTAAALGVVVDGDAVEEGVAVRVQVRV